MIECVILSVDQTASCIEAEFNVGGRWYRNRIHRPVNSDRTPVDLSDPEQVKAYVERYAIDNYQLATIPESRDTPLSLLEPLDRALSVHDERTDPAMLARIENLE